MAMVFAVSSVKPITRPEAVAKLKSLKPGQSFEVPTKSQQTMVCSVAATLKSAAVISFFISTRRNEDGDGYTVFRMG